MLRQLKSGESQGLRFSLNDRPAEGDAFPVAGVSARGRGILKPQRGAVIFVNGKSSSRMNAASNTRCRQAADARRDSRTMDIARASTAVLFKRRSTSVEKMISGFMAAIFFWLF